MYNRKFQSITGWLTVAFFAIWLTELRRGVSFLESYWAFMLFLASLMFFAYVRYRRIMSEQDNKNVTSANKSTSKATKSSKK